MQGSNELAARIGHRRRHGNAAHGQVAHQVQVERQLLEVEHLEHRQHVFAALGAEEEVAVLDA